MSHDEQRRQAHQADVDLHDINRVAPRRFKYPKYLFLNYNTKDWNRCISFTEQHPYEKFRRRPDRNEGFGCTIQLRTSVALILCIENDGFQEHDVEIESARVLVKVQLETETSLMLLDQLQRGNKKISRPRGSSWQTQLKSRSPSQWFSNFSQTLSDLSMESFTNYLFTKHKNGTSFD